MDKHFQGAGIPSNLGKVPALSTAYTGDHQRMRRGMMAAFSDKAIRGQEASFSYLCIDQIISKLKDKGADGPQNVVAWYNWCTFDIMGDLSFGESFGCLEETQYHTWVKSIFDFIKLSTWMQVCQTYHALPPIYFLVPKVLSDAKQERDNKSYEKTEH